MAIGDLTALIMPPAEPNQIGAPEEWMWVEQELGVTFPIDFRQYVHTYGTGR
jgi:hypothetical protein